MTRLTALLLLVAALGDPIPAQVAWNDTTLAAPGDVLSAEFVPLGEGGAPELAVAVWNRELRRRELRLHPVTGDRVSATPRLVLPILEDIVAWGVAELDSDAPGHELLLLTPSSAWSYRAEAGSYGANAVRLFEHPLLYDVPDRGSLPRWEYVLPAPGGDMLLLPSPTGYSVWAPARDDAGARTWRETARFDTGGELDADGVGASVRVREGRGRDGIELRASARAGLDVGEELDGVLGPPLMSVARTMRSPALVDMDGDGLLDVVTLASRTVSVHPSGPAGVPALPSVQNPLPEGFYESEVEGRDLLLRDLDADGDADLLALIEGPDVSVLNRNNQLTVLVLRNDGSGALDRTPRQALKFQGVRLSADLVDADADGRPDLVVDVFLAPDLTELSSPDQLETRLRVLVFRGRGDATFEQQPFVRFEHVVDAATIDEAVRFRELAGDLTGDGLPDLVTSDILGRIAVRPLGKSGGFFGGESWKLASTPAVRLPTARGQRELALQDINADGVLDILSTHEDRVMVFVSQRAGGDR